MNATLRVMTHDNMGSVEISRNCTVKKRFHRTRIHLELFQHFKVSIYTNMMKNEFSLLTQKLIQYTRNKNMNGFSCICP